MDKTADVAAEPVPVRRPSKKAQQASQTRERILDVAEDLFGRHGYYGVTIREVATATGVDTALLYYYFKNKQDLFDAVFLRRAEVVNRERLDAMAAYERDHAGALTPEGVIAAFLDPVLERTAKGGAGWRSYFAIVAQANSTPVWGSAVMARYFDPVIQRLIELMQKALPQARREDLYWAYHNLSGSLTLTLAATGRLDTLSGGACSSSDIPALRPRMIAYAAAGFRAVCVA
ncbi:MAG TPA: TetR/AcrR family transcriptional regulator [Caulobacteraceae bacterium]|nr:TetR/AcrR family transcriptional regulator [Caulobacteraceae bacterium]